MRQGGRLLRLGVRVWMQARGPRVRISFGHITWCLSLGAGTWLGVRVSCKHVALRLGVGVSVPSCGILEAGCSSPGAGTWYLCSSLVQARGSLLKAGCWSVGSVTWSYGCSSLVPSRTPMGVRVSSRHLLFVFESGITHTFVGSRRLHRFCSVVLLLEPTL